MTDISTDHMLIRVIVFDDHPDAISRPFGDFLDLVTRGKNVFLDPLPWLFNLGSQKVAITYFKVYSDRDTAEKLFAEGPDGEVATCDLVLVDNDWEAQGEGSTFGIELLENSKCGNKPFIAIWTHADTFRPEMVTRVLDAGADGLINKEEAIHLLNAFVTAIKRAALRAQLKQFEKLGGLLLQADPGLRSCSSRMQETLRDAGAYAIWPNLPVLILGETGTGKTRLARAIHRASPRAQKSFVKVDLGQSPRELIASHLFGSDRGAYTGAVARRGLIEEAAGGTVFMDEVQNIPFDVQHMLLQVIEEKTFRRLGSTVEQHADVRFVFASNRVLSQMVSGGEFRDDLYSRINEAIVQLPTLKQRAEDIPDLAREFLAEFLENNGFYRNLAVLSEDALDRLSQHSWADNIRGLRNTVRRSIAKASGKSQLAATDLVFNDENSPVGPDFLSSIDAAKIYRVAPRQGAQRNVLDLLIKQSPGSVPTTVIHDAIAESGSNPSKSSLHMIVHRLNARLKPEGICVSYDSGSNSYALSRYVA